MVIKLDFKLALTSSRHWRTGRSSFMAVSLHQTLNHKCLFFPKGFFLSSVPQLSPHSSHSASNSQFLAINTSSVFQFILSGFSLSYPGKARRVTEHRNDRCPFGTWIQVQIQPTAAKNQNSWVLKRSTFKCRWDEIFRLSTQLYNFYPTETVVLSKSLYWPDLSRMSRKNVFSSVIVLVCSCHNKFQNFCPWICTVHMLLKISRNFNMSTVYEPWQQSR